MIKVNIMTKYELKDHRGNEVNLEAVNQHLDYCMFLLDIKSGITLGN